MSLINMENGVGTGSGGGSSWEQNRLISELTQGREMAQQLQNHFINTPASSSSQETSHLLLRGIVSSYEKALSMLNIPVAPSPGLIMSESPPSLFGSPRSDQDSDQDPRDGSTTSRKRKSIPRWTQQVRVSPGMGLEGPLDDGFSWRKYGQKDILGAKYPRGYYRCTHRNVQGCLATKQVQRSDEDPTIFEITYRGRHTCTHASSTSHLIQPPSPEQRQLPEPSNTINNVNDQSQEMLLSFRTGLKVRTQDLDTTHQKHQQQQQIPSFPFPKHSSNNNSSSSYMGMSLSQTTSFVSPATSGSNNYFSPTSGLNGSFGGNRNYFHSQESELTHEIISAATSATNSPTINLDFPFGPMDFDPNFCFGNQGFFSGN